MCGWLAAHAATGKPLPRRQELPTEAFVDVTKLIATHAALPAHIQAAVLPIVSISYCWLEPHHPDATGEQLRHIIETLEPHAMEWREFFPDVGCFWDWGSLYQKDRHGDRTPDEAAAFKRALTVTMGAMCGIESGPLGLFSFCYH